MRNCLTHYVEDNSGYSGIFSGLGTFFNTGVGQFVGGLGTTAAGAAVEGAISRKFQKDIVIRHETPFDVQALPMGQDKAVPASVASMTGVSYSQPDIVNVQTPESKFMTWLPFLTLGLAVYRTIK